MSLSRKLLGLDPIEDYPAKAILFCANPGQGKTTRLKLEIANDAIAQAEERWRPWPWPQRFVPPPIRCYDPKRELGGISARSLMDAYRDVQEGGGKDASEYEDAAVRFRAVFGKKSLDDFKEFQYFDTAGEAAHAALSDMRGILIIEELLTVDPGDYPVITKALAIRRTSTEGNGLIIYATTQRPKIMPVAMRAIPDELRMGQIIEPIDIDALRPVIGPKRAAMLPYVPRGEWVTYRQGEAHGPESSEP